MGRTVRGLRRGIAVVGGDDFDQRSSTTGLVDPDVPVLRTLWPFVGRDHELATVLHHLIGDEPGAIVLAGQPGAGRTRLAQESVHTALRAGHPTAWATATRTMAAIPLGALVHLVPVGTSVSKPAAALQATVASLGRPTDEPWFVVAIDDAHLLDELSASLVHKLVLTRTASVVLTVLSGVPEPDPVAALWKDGLAARLEVGPLSRIEQEQLLHAALDGVVDSRTCESIWRLTRGSALLLREVVEAGHATGSLRVADGVWRWDGALTPTRRLSEVVQAQVGELRPAEQAAVELLAVGEPLALPELIEMTSSNVVATLERRGIVSADPMSRRIEVRLAQPLHAEVVRAQLPQTEARRLRRKLASRAAPWDQGDFVRTCALLLDGGGPSPEPSLLVDAAAAANSRRSHRTAEQLARAAVEDGSGFDAYVALVEALRWQGRSLDAESAAADAALLARTGEERARLAITRALNLFYGLGRAEEAMAKLDEATESVAPQTASVQAVHSVLSFSAGCPQEAADLGRSVLDMQPLGESPQVWACATLTATQAVLGSTTEALTFAEQGWAADGRRPPDPEVSSARLVLAHDEVLALCLAGRISEAEERAAKLHRASMAGVASAGDGMAALQRGSSALAAGRAAIAVRWLAEAAARLTDSDPIGCLPLCRANLTQAFALLGDPAAAARVSDANAAARPSAVQVFEPQTVLAEAWRAAVDQRTAEAGDEALRAASIAASMGQPAVEAHALHTAVRFGRAADVTDQLRELAEHVDGLAPAFAAHADAVTRGLGDRLDDVAVEFESAGADLLAAEAAAHAAEAHERDGHRRRATASAARAMSLAKGCGVATTPALNRSAPPSLTPREREVAALAAAGLPSPEIARQLVISVRTVETHLTNAFGKLGIHRRSELDAALHANPELDL
jgi:DNA-binding CsgD family transcriptional regulator